MRNRAAVIYLCNIYLYSEDTPSQVSHIVDHLLRFQPFSSQMSQSLDHLRQVGISQAKM